MLWHYHPRVDETRSNEDCFDETSSDEDCDEDCVDEEPDIDLTEADKQEDVESDCLPPDAYDQPGPSKRLKLSNKGVLKVSNNMKTILKDGKRADFTLKLGDREWPVHKVILESRCEYFENMFRHDWIENTVGEVKFDEIEEEALDSVLQFIYTGVFADMSVKNVFEICVAAHKFLLEDLKELCIEYIKETMCVETVCRVLVIANVYDSKDLNESAIEIFTQDTS